MAKTKRKPLDLEFGEPQPIRRDYRWGEVAEALRARPGEWALVHKDLPASVPWAVNKGRVSAVAPYRGFRTRTVGNRRIPQEDGKETRVCSELWMVYEAEHDETKAKWRKKV